MTSHSLSVTSRSSMETEELIKLVLALKLPSTDLTLCCKEICISPKIMYSFWNFFPNSGLRNFRHGLVG